MTNVYDAVTEKIIASLTEGIIPWRKDWKTTGGLPFNFATGKPYRGMNILLLLGLPYASSAFLTYNQASDRGWQVRKGSKGHAIFFWKFEKKQDEHGDDYTRAFARKYTVFNIEQIDGIPTSEESPVIESLDSPQSIIDAYLQRTGIEKRGGQPSYAPLTDSIQMPSINDFQSSEGYYATFFHECVHSTGIKSRLDRFQDADQFRFKSESYSKEELLAEFGSAFLCADSGITNDNLLTNSTAYIHGWLKVLRNDKQLAVVAAQRAQKAVDFILDRKPVTDVQSA